MSKPYPKTSELLPTSYRTAPSVNIMLDSKPLEAIQSFQESINGKEIIVTIDRIIIDDFSAINYILNNGPVTISVGIGESTVSYKNLRISKAERSFTTEDFVSTEILVLTSANPDDGLEALKATVKRVTNSGL